MTNKKPAKVKQIETVVVSFEDYQNPDFRYPSKWVFRNAMGDLVFIKTSSREVAMRYIEDNFQGKYTLRQV